LLVLTRELPELLRRLEAVELREAVELVSLVVLEAIVTVVETSVVERETEEVVIGVVGTETVAVVVTTADVVPETTRVTVEVAGAAETEVVLLRVVEPIGVEAVDALQPPWHEVTVIVEVVKVVLVMLPVVWVTGQTVVVVKTTLDLIVVPATPLED